MRLTVIDRRLFSDCQKHKLENFGKTTVVAADATALLFWKQIGKYLDSSDSV